jgi:hypothetical protein
MGTAVAGDSAEHVPQLQFDPILLVYLSMYLGTFFPLEEEGKPYAQARATAGRGPVRQATFS